MAVSSTTLHRPWLVQWSLQFSCLDQENAVRIEGVGTVPDGWVSGELRHLFIFVPLITIKRIFLRYTTYIQVVSRYFHWLIIVFFTKTAIWIHLVGSTACMQTFSPLRCLGEGRGTRDMLRNRPS